MSAKFPSGGGGGGGSKPILSHPSKNGPAAGVKLAYIKLTFSEYGHVAYQIKGNEVYNNMLNIFPLHTPLIPVVGSKGHFFLFWKYACQINWNEAENTMQANILHYYTPTTPRLCQKVKTIYFWRSCCIREKEVKSIWQVWPYARPWFKSDIEIVQISLFWLNLVNW